MFAVSPAEYSEVGFHLYYKEGGGDIKGNPQLRVSCDVLANYNGEKSVKEKGKKKARLLDCRRPRESELFSLPLILKTRREPSDSPACSRSLWRAPVYSTHVRPSASFTLRLRPRRLARRL